MVVGKYLLNCRLIIEHSNLFRLFNRTSHIFTHVNLWMAFGNGVHFTKFQKFVLELLSIESLKVDEI